MTDEQTHLTQADISRIASKIDRPLVLVGLMGVGKSTVGRKLAALLRRDFVDADQEIELAAQRSIAEIFEEFGEQYFRDGERRVIARLMGEGYGVIATGGGAFIDDETRELILAPASKEGFKPTARGQILGATTRAIPALSTGLLYARDDKRLVCVDLKP